MSQAHTEIVLTDLFMVDDTKITQEANAFLALCRKINSQRYSGYRVCHIYGERLQFGWGDRLFAIGEANTSCIEFFANSCSLSDLDVAHELLLGFLLVLDDAHPSVSLSVTTSAPREFLLNTFRIARGFRPDLPEPSWLPEMEVVSLDHGSIPSDMDFRA